MGKAVDNDNVNYMDIQLRDMDLYRIYSSEDLTNKFLDTQRRIYSASQWQRKTKLAVKHTATILEGQSINKQGEDIVTQKIRDLIKTQRKREITYLNQVSTQLKKRVKDDVSFDSSLIDKINKMISALKGKGETTLDQAKKFNQFCRDFIGKTTANSSSSIVELLRSDALVTAMSGQGSKIFSTKIAEKAGVNVSEFYSDLFNVFFGIQSSTSKKLTSSTKNMKELAKKGVDISSTLALLQNNTKKSAIFEAKFKEFIRKYFATESFSQQILDSTAPLIDSALFSSIYQNFSGSKTKKKVIVSGTSKNAKGLSESNEKQLKGMLKEVFKIVLQNQSTPMDIEIPNYLVIHSSPGYQGGAYQNKLLVEIDQHKSNGTANNAGVAPQLREKFMNILIKEMKHINKKQKLVDSKAIDKEREELKRAIFSKQASVYFSEITRTAFKKGEDNLKAMAAYGEGQMRGLLGEIAAAYELQTSLDYDNRANVSITGAQRGLTGQVHYDILFGGTGFQVKQYSGMKISLYNSEKGFTPASSAMGKYYPKDVIKGIRFLTANGRFLTEADIPWNRYSNDKIILDDIKRASQPFVGNFLRVTDEINKQVNSDVYILNGMYIPSSYILSLALKQYEKYLEKEGENSLISVTKEREYPKWVEKKKQESPALVEIDSIKRQLTPIKIKFKGVTINLSDFQ